VPHEKRIKMQHRSSEASQRVEAIPGIGVIGATAIVATVTDPTIFRSGRDFAAWIGLVPRQDSTWKAAQRRRRSIRRGNKFSPSFVGSYNWSLR
jgi:transposase